MLTAHVPAESAGPCTKSSMLALSWSPCAWRCCNPSSTFNFQSFCTYARPDPFSSLPARSRRFEPCIAHQACAYQRLVTLSTSLSIAVITVFHNITPPLQFAACHQNSWRASAAAPFWLAQLCPNRDPLNLRNIPTPTLPGTHDARRGFAPCVLQPDSVTPARR